MKSFTLVTCVIGGLIGFFVSDINFFSFNKSFYFYYFSYFFRTIWFIPLISTIGVVYYPIRFGLKIFKRLDQGWVEFFGIHYFFIYFKNFSKIIQIFQINSLKIYFTLFVF